MIAVTEGYSTERFALSGYTVPPTPFTSPVKQPSSAKTVTTTPIFRSANDTLQEVFMTPPNSAVALPSPSPSPRKRGRAVLELEDENEDTDYRCNHGEDLVMKMETDPDDEERNVSPSMTPSRPVRRLRKFASSTQPPLPSCDFSVDRQDVAVGGHNKTFETENEKWSDMFNHPF